MQIEMAQDMKTRVWFPQAGSQVLFMASPVRETLYDGTRGPGKTDALIMSFAQYTGRGFGPAWRGILFRRTFPELEDVLVKSSRWLPVLFGARFMRSTKDYKWIFPGGEELLFRSFFKPDDYWKYHGHEYPWIGWEELTNWPTLEGYNSMISCNRSSVQGLPRMVRATCNPWGCGHAAVKDAFISPARPGQVFDGPYGPRVRVHGNIYENKILLAADPEYLRVLEGIQDKEKRKAWLFGSWDINPGAFFADFWNEKVHVIKTWTPPTNWPCFRSFDWGSAHPFAVGWWTISDGTQAPDGRHYPRGAKIRFAEWYGADRTKRNTGLGQTSQFVAQGIRDREQVWKEQGLKIYPGPADNQIFDHVDGPSIADKMRAAAGIVWERSDKSRVTGWDTLKGLLKPEKGDPLVYFMDRCKDSIRTLPDLARDPNNWDDVDTGTEDHLADEIRYAAMFKGPKVPSRGGQWK